MAIITEKAIAEIVNCKRCKKNIGPDDVFCKYCGTKQTADSRKPLKRANGTGCISKMSGRRKKPWIVRLAKTEKGIVVQKSIGTFETKTAALVALEEYNNHGLPQLHDATFSALYKLWSAKHYPTVSLSMQQGYESCYKYLSDIETAKMKELKTAHYQKVIDKAITAGRSHSTCNKIKILCGQVCKYAMSNDVIDKNYAEFVVLQKYEKPDKDIFTDDEINKVFAATAENPVAEVIFVLIYTGMRIGEIFSIEKANVNLKSRFMTGGEKTAAGKNRTIPLHKHVMPIVCRWLHAGPGKFLLDDIKDIQHNPDNFRRRDYYDFLKENGIKKLNPHCCRHTFASIMVKAGAEQEALKNIMGHEKYETTSEIYTHTNLKQLTDAINRL
ncbi:MAG: tyrosine-type recombinase/integrase [Eubacteriales bacterium]